MNWDGYRRKQSWTNFRLQLPSLLPELARSAPEHRTRLLWGCVEGWWRRSHDLPRELPLQDGEYTAMHDITTMRVFDAVLSDLPLFLSTGNTALVQTFICPLSSYQSVAPLFTVLHERNNVPLLRMIATYCRAHIECRRRCIITALRMYRFKAISGNLPGGTEENHEKSRSG
jgi:hypothetical protein